MVPCLDDFTLNLLSSRSTNALFSDTFCKLLHIALTKSGLHSANFLSANSAVIYGPLLPRGKNSARNVDKITYNHRNNVVLRGTT